MAHPAALRVFLIGGSPRRKSSTSSVLNWIGERLREGGCEVDLLDLAEEPLPHFNPDTTYSAAHYGPLRERVHRADVLVLATPDYHGSVSGALKNFLDHFWKEFTGKLFGSVVASHEKGLTATDQIRTVVRQCYGWSLPYSVAYAEPDDVKDGEIVSAALGKRLEMMVRDLRIYGRLLADQRHADLAGSDPGFLAKLRK